MNLLELEQAIAQKRSQHLYRQRIVTEPEPPLKRTAAHAARVIIDGKSYLSFCGNDYLGLATHPKVIAAMQQAAADYGVGSTASILVSGYKKIHQQFEVELADFIGAEQALLLPSGYLANLGAVCALAAKSAVIYHDKENHASLIDAVILSRAKSYRYQTVANLNTQLVRHAAHEHTTKLTNSINSATKLIITESIFSMSGRTAELPALAELASKQQAWLLIDDAHGIGISGTTGAGAATTFVHGLPAKLILTIPLGKAFGCAGGIIAGSKTFIEHCVQQARSYIYSTGIAPPLAAANLASLKIMRQEIWRRQKLAELIQQFKSGWQRLGLADQGLSLLPSNSQIQSVIVYDEAKALELSEKLFAAGIWLRAMRYPTVPARQARLRISLTAAHSTADIDTLLEQLASCLKQL